MLFVNRSFLYLFLPITYAVFWMLRSKRQRHAWLTLTGYVFYSFWDWRFCGLMLFSTVVSYAAGLGLLRFQDAARRRLCLVLPITADLLLLGFFKYADFLLESSSALARTLGLAGPYVRLGVVLPVGISFYTFHTITYVVDCWRGVVRPTRSFLEFSCYVSLFAQLVSGPIVRFRQIEGDLERIDSADRRRMLDPAFSFFALGFAKKVIVADGLGVWVDRLLSSGAPAGGGTAWLALLGYAYQIYFDFSGYSDMAVGLGLLFGLRLPQNFDSPYRAVGPADFWRRWHMSLSTVLRDYLYVPLGGSRRSAGGTTRNLMITMLLGGLWHGASWTFVAWGGYHGLLLSLERAFPRAREGGAAPRRAVTFLLVLLGWVLFRARSLSDARAWYRALLSFDVGALPQGFALLLVLLVIAAALAHFGPNTFELRHEGSPLATATIALLFAISLVFLYAGRPSPFLYFQF